jgi:hypothetical protein
MFKVDFAWRKLFAAWMVLLPLLCCAGAEDTRSLYDGATVMFEQATLIKPRETTNFGRAFMLAPLLLQETTTASILPSPGLSAILSPSDEERGRVGIRPTQSSPPEPLNPSGEGMAASPLPSENLHMTGEHGVTRPALRILVSDQRDNLTRRVFFQPGSVTINGRSCEQMTYWWFHGQRNNGCESGLRGQVQRDPAIKGGAQLLLRLKAPSPLRSAGAAYSDNRQPPAQGVRLTLNTNGVPVICEMLGGDSSIQQIFVTQSLEAAALVEFGPALDGRRFAVERSLSDAPHVVVPRVLDDPPDIMGPILYLRAGSHALATMICRCMDAQAKKLTDQGLYELVPAEASGNTPDATRLDAAFPRGLPEDFTNPSNGLSRSLRLPREF